MGEKRVKIASNQQELNQFMKCLLKDIQAMDIMLKDEWFETDEIMIGAEQEICLIDEHNKPSPRNMEILDKLNHPNFTTELAKFNIEANLDPLIFTGNCFSEMEANIHQLLEKLQEVTEIEDINYLLTGILPTIRRFDVELENLTPLERYYALIEAINKLRGQSFELRIEGMDELNIIQQSALIEACNTSFQVHLQIKPEEFVSKYNIAQAIAAPVMAVSCNSPMLFGKRLWNETRIALFQQSVDTRVTGEHLRFSSPRVTFGNDWLQHSILDLYKEDIMRFKVLLTTDLQEDVLECLSKKVTPKLRALNVHNSTVYRWNRPCYGISSSGKPHLRIENRIFPSGPTVVDEMANAAFWIGLMNGFGDAYPDVRDLIDFDDARANFIRASRLGLSAKFVWKNGQVLTDHELIQKELIPIARQGLEKANILKDDIDKYLDIIDERSKVGRTGAQWMLNSYSKLIKRTSKEEAINTLVSSSIQNQKENLPVHTWKLAELDQLNHWEPYSLLVEEFMTTDVFTVNEEEILELGAEIMDWKNIRYIPIENKQGDLVGLVTSRQLLRYFTYIYRNGIDGVQDAKTVKDLMLRTPITVAPHATVIEAMELMNKHKIGCLPVVNKGKLVGIITEGNFLDITSSLFKRLAAKKKKNYK